MQAVYEESFKENYYALYLSIVQKITSTKACIAMDISVEQSTVQNVSDLKNFKEKDLQEAIKLKSKGMTWKEVAEIYDIVDNTLYARVKRYMGDDWKNREWRKSK